MEIKKNLEKLVEESLTADDLKDCFLLEILISSSKKVQVLLDSPEGVTFKKCRKISRMLEKVIDEEGWLGEKYILEVSSAGVDRPLTDARQYPMNIGRKIEIKQKDKTKWKGTFSAFTDDSVSITFETVRKEGKKKIKEEVTQQVLLSEIDELKVKISF